MNYKHALALYPHSRDSTGYHCDTVGGPAYSDTHSLSDLERIRNRIRGDFCDIGQLGHILRKAYKPKAFSAFDLTYLAAKLPKILYRPVLMEFEKKGWVRAH